MLILAFETTGKNASSAIINEEGKLWVAKSQENMNHLKDILVLTQECFDKAGLSPSDIDYVAASVGPGSYTGIRIGVTTARTFAQCNENLCIGVSSLEGMALEAADYAKLLGINYICPIINARRNQTYGAIFKLNDDKLIPVVVGAQYMIDDILNRATELNEKVLLTGDGCDSYIETIRATMEENAYDITPEECRYPSAGSIAKLALENVDKAIPYEELLPNYMRLSEAEQRLKEGTLSKRIKGEL